MIVSVWNDKSCATFTCCVLRRSMQSSGDLDNVGERESQCLQVTETAWKPCIDAEQL